MQCLCTPSQLCFLFAQIIQEGYPAAPLWTAFQNSLSNDHPMYPFDCDVALDAALHKIADYLLHTGKSLTDFGLPNPIVRSAEVEDEMQFLWREEEHLRDEHHHQYNLLNNEQHAAFPILAQVIENRECQERAFFIEDRPGRGKTFLIQCLLVSHCCRFVAMKSGSYRNVLLHRLR